MLAFTRDKLEKTGNGEWLGIGSGYYNERLQVPTCQSDHVFFINN